MGHDERFERLLRGLVSVEADLVVKGFPEG